MKPQFVITLNTTVTSNKVDGSFNKSEQFKEINVFPFEQLFQAKRATDGYPNCFVINLKNKISNINLHGFSLEFVNLNPCDGYMVADWCPVRKRLKLYDSNGYVAQMY